MSFDNTPCGTTCDSKVNTEYVRKLEEFICKFDRVLQDNYYPEDIGNEMSELWSENEAFLIKVAQQNHSTTGVS